MSEKTRSTWAGAQFRRAANYAGRPLGVLEKRCGATASYQCLSSDTKGLADAIDALEITPEQKKAWKDQLRVPGNAKAEGLSSSGSCNQRFGKTNPEPCPMTLSTSHFLDS